MEKTQINGVMEGYRYILRYNYYCSSRSSVWSDVFDAVADRGELRTVMNYYYCSISSSHRQPSLTLHAFLQQKEHKQVNKK